MLKFHASSRLCSLSVDYCENRACNHHGECESLPELQSYQCHCSPGWEGLNCEFQTCLGHTCFNGGTCG